MTVKNDDVDNYHRDKIHKKDIAKQKIHSYLQKIQIEPRPIVVPNGLQNVHTAWNLPKPLNCSLGITSATQDVFVAHYGAGPINTMCMWSNEIGSTEIKKLKGQIKARLTNIAFVSSRNIFFASATDLSLRSYGNEFQLHSKIQLSHSILSMIYDDRLDVVFTGTVGIIEQWRINKSLTDPPDLLRHAKLEDPLSGVKPWITFLKCYKEEHKLIALTGSALYILNEKTLEQIAYLENRHTHPMTACLSYWPRQYLITGAKDGEIKIWNMYMRSFPYVGSFRGHTNMIIYLTIHPSDNLLISASTDSTIRIWRIETFQEMYRYSVIDSLINVVLVNANRLMYATTLRIQVLELSIPHTLFTLIGSNILSMSRIMSFRKPSRIFVLGEDGGARVISPRHGNILTTSFPIITHKPVSFHHNPLEERIYVILEDGSVMVICTETNPCKTIQLLHTSKHEDRVHSMEIIYRKNHGSNDQISSMVLVAYADGRIGMLRGDGLVFETLYSNKGDIEKMVASPMSSNNVCDLLTCNSDGFITMWKIKEDRKRSISLHPLKDFHFDGKVNHIAIMGNIILVSLKRKLIFAKFDRKKGQNFDFVIHEPTRDERHLSDITNLSCCSTLYIFASVSLDGVLKIWDTDACLLREISFDASLSALCFANERGDLLIGFQNNVHLIGVTDYLPKFCLDHILNDDTIMDDEKEYCIPFDPVLKFWYDPLRVESVSVSQAHLNVQSVNKDHLFRSCSKANDNLMLKENSFDDLQVSSSLRLDQGSSMEMPTDPSYPFKQSVARLIEALKTIRKIEAAKNQRLIDELMEPDAIPRDIFSPIIELSDDLSESDSKENFHPCAPDGFIPNSVIREKYEIKPPENIPFQVWNPDRRFDGVPVEEEEDLEYIEESDEEFEEKARVWFSDDDSEAASTPFSFSSSPIKTPKGTKNKENNKVKISENPAASVKSPSKEKKSPTKSKFESKLKKEVENKKEAKTLLTKVVKETEKEELLIPYPFDQYYEEYWFPKTVGFEFSTVTRVLTTKLESIPVMYLQKLLECILKTHQFSPLQGEILDNVVLALFKLVENTDGKVRHHALKGLCSLGVNRQDIVLKLLPFLEDSSVEVKVEVKTALASMAGIVDETSLIKKLQEYGKFQEDEPLPNDADILMSYKDLIEDRRESFKERMKALYEKFDKTNIKMTAWVDHVMKPSEYTYKRKSITIRKRKRRDTEKIVRTELTSSLTNTTFDREFLETTSSLANYEQDEFEDRESANRFPSIEEQDFNKENKSLQENIQENRDEDKQNIESIQRNHYGITESSQTIDNEEEITMLVDETRKSMLDNHERNYGDRNVSTTIDSPRIVLNTVDLPEITVNITDRTDNKHITDKRYHKQTDGLLDDRYNGTGMDRDSCDLEMPHLNKVLYADIGRTVSEAIINIAPNLGRKFSTKKEIEILNKVVSNSNNLNNVRTVVENVMIEEQAAKSRERWKFSLEHSDSIDNQMDNVNGQQSAIERWNIIKKGTDTKTIQSILTLEQVAVTTAISVLRGRRKNSILINSDGILSNDVLNDMTMLLNLLSDKNIKRYSSVKKMMKQVRDLQNDLQDKKSIHVINQNVNNLLPLPMRSNMVKGVTGERIVSALHILPPIIKKTEERSRGYIKAIPERNGTKTSSNNGSTRYGKMEYEWTTFTSRYDMGVDNLFRDKIQESKEKKRFRNRKKRIDPLDFQSQITCKSRNSRLPSEMDQHEDMHETGYRFNTRVALPKISHNVGVVNKIKCAPPPPNTAEESIRRQTRLEIYTPS